VIPKGKPDWRDEALCAQADPDAFFPEKGESAEPAKSVCAGCPSRLPCLEYSLERGEHFGVWGGLAEADRRRLRSQDRGRQREAAA
jgi:WhiB family redox-sensing transcriptional regulator